MSERETFVGEGFERIHNAMDAVGEEFERLQKRVQKRRARLEKEAWKRLSWIEKGTRKQVQRARSELLNSPLVQRAASARSHLNKRFEDRLDGLFGLLPYARQKEVQNLERKLAQLTKKLNKLEKESRSAGPGSHASQTGI